MNGTETVVIVGAEIMTKDLLVATETGICSMVAGLGGTVEETVEIASGNVTVTLTVAREKIARGPRPLLPGSERALLI